MPHVALQDGLTAIMDETPLILHARGTSSAWSAAQSRSLMCTDTETAKLRDRNLLELLHGFSKIWHCASMIQGHGSEHDIEASLQHPLGEP